MNQNLSSFISEVVRVHKPHDKVSFLNGFLAGAEAFAIWKDGQRLLGIGNVTYSELEKEVKELLAEKSDGEE